MSYKIRISNRAQADIDRAADHIEYVLKNPQAADSLLDEVDEVISSLVTMPERYAVVDDDVLASWGIRFTRVKNYLAFYTIDDDHRTVFIVRFLFGRSDWLTILRNEHKKPY